MGCSRRVATASADKTVKIWDAGALALLQTATFADKPAIEDMQVKEHRKGFTYRP